MIKKVITILAAVLGIFVVTYMYTDSNMLTILNAQSAPVFELPKGSKVVLGEYNNKEIVWDIGNNNNNGNYVLMSSKPLVDDIPKYSASIGCKRYDSGKFIGEYYYACPNTQLVNEINKIIVNTNESFLINKNFFIPNYAEIGTGGTLGLTREDRAYKTSISYYLDERGEHVDVINAGWTNEMRTLVQSALVGLGTIQTSQNVIVSTDEYIRLIYDYYKGALIIQSIQVI